MEHKQIKKRIQRMTSGQPVYPALLKEIRDYPKELYYIGDPKLLEEKCVSIVGSRKTNQYGRSTAYSFGKALGQRGITVVSGMAVGIDTCAHEGALQEKGNTSCCAGLRTGSVLSSAQPGVKRKNRISRDRAFRVSAGDCGAAVLFSPEKPDHQRTFPAYGRSAGRKPQWCADHGRTGGRSGQGCWCGAGEYRQRV